MIAAKYKSNYNESRIFSDCVVSFEHRIYRELTCAVNWVFSDAHGMLIGSWIRKAKYIKVCFDREQVCSIYNRHALEKDVSLHP